MALKGNSKQNETDRSIDNSAKTLLANIRFMSVDDPIRTIAITSAVPNEGKTFVAANLARAMASSGMRTLIVECDMRRRSMARELEVHPQHGLYSVMSGEVSLADAVVQVGPRLEFLDSEPHIPNPSDLLNTRRFSALVEALHGGYNYVVFDTPPVGTFVDAAVLGSHVDALFMVVRERHTHHDELVRAAEQLKTANVPLAGIVMNFCERQSSEYYYEYYYKEGAAGRERRVRRSKSHTGVYQPVTDISSAEAAARRQAAAQAKAEAAVQAEAVARAQAAEQAAERARAAAQAAVVAARRPDSWDNAPDLGDGEVREVGVKPLEGAHSARGVAVPSIGNTSAMSADEIAARMSE